MGKGQKSRNSSKKRFKDTFFFANLKTKFFAQNCSIFLPGFSCSLILDKMPPLVEEAHPMLMFASSAFKPLEQLELASLPRKSKPFLKEGVKMGVQLFF